MNVGASLLVGGRYRLDEEIGKGGMGAVFSALDAKTGRVVALKLLLEADQKSLARFRREARAAASLSHAHIVGLLDFDIDDPNGAYIIMELVHGESLHALLAREGRLEPARAVAIAMQLLSALAHAHGAGILHRDVKPGNILVSVTAAARDYVRLVDFGLAKHTDPARDGPAVTTMASMLGTPAYMPPEQMMGEVLDARADLYSCGLVCYRMLAGVDAFVVKGNERIVRVMSGDPGRPLATVAPWVDARVAALVDACVAPNKERRPASASDVIDHLARMGFASPTTPSAVVHGDVQRAPAAATSANASAAATSANASAAATVGPPPGPHSSPSGATMAPSSVNHAPTAGGPPPLGVTTEGTAYAAPYFGVGPPSRGPATASANGPPASGSRRTVGLVLAVVAFASVACASLGIAALLFWPRGASPAGPSASAPGGQVTIGRDAPDAAARRTLPSATAASARRPSDQGIRTPVVASHAPLVSSATATASCFCMDGVLKMCGAVQTPKCQCGGFSAAICKEPWTADRKCASGLASFGGPGRKSGEKCSGFEFATQANGQFVPAGSRADSTLGCDLCPNPTRVPGVQGAPCKAFDNNGTPSDGAFDCR